jgi:Uma2 family endonuclease
MGAALLTSDEFFQIDDPESRHRELVGGVLVMSPTPTLRHQRLAKRLLRAFLALEDSGHGEVLYEINAELSKHDVLAPDLVYVRAENARILEERGVVGGPDLIIEVLSPSTRSRDLGQKKRLYARSGVTHCWTVDPDDDRLDVRRLRGRSYGRATVFRPPQVLTVDDLPGLSLDLTKLFARP